MNSVDSTSQSLSFAIFAALVSVTMLLCVMTSAERDDLDEFYTGFRTLAPLRNGLAIAGDYISAATVLSTIGIIALAGFDGLVLALSTALSLLLLMVLLAEPLRNAGRFTMGDALTHRGASRKVRLAASAVTLAALLPLMVFQLSGAGHLVTLVLGFEGSSVRTAVIIALGLLMIGYAAIGGMKGTALIHIIKLVVLLGASLLLALLVMDKVGWDVSRLMTLADARSGRGDAYSRSGLLIEATSIGKVDLVFSALTVVFGAACLPHVTMRMFTAKDAPAIRRAMSYAVTIMAVFVLLIAIIGAGATALLGRDIIEAGGPQGSTAILQLSQAILADSEALSTLVFTTVATAVFLTLLSSVAGMILACGNSLAHDLYAHVVARRRDEPSPRHELRLARLAAFAVGLPAIALAVLVQDKGLRALIILSFCISASAIAPALVYGLFWRRFTRAGMLGSLIGGTVSAVVVMAFSTTVSGTPQSLFPDADFDIFPLTTSGLISMPVGFLLGWACTFLSSPEAQERQRHEYAAKEPRLLAGTRRG
ncbi:cation acetate symporter [Streptomyces albidus (ex Kaewkla and Franco 2022)]|uniref:sodium/solute symporter n=1 Tax=Streptomyces albidus (ex Kaewkla and Franco 2022) TaxID=722709 RepID=UPI002815548E|nr:cation acetate symporter [Streptomyces albidus (ex Kaewkla and Franco 2022)]